MKTVKLINKERAKLSEEIDTLSMIKTLYIASLAFIENILFCPRADYNHNSKNFNCACAFREFWEMELKLFIPGNFVFSETGTYIYMYTIKCTSLL